MENCFIINGADKTVCREVQHGTDEYKQMITLRDEILRKPLLLTFSTEELAKEKDSFHLGCWDSGMLVACLVLKPVGGRQIRMRQLAVSQHLQGRGFGTRLVKYSESFAKQHGYHEIVLHARESAIEFYEKLGYQKRGEQFIEVTIPHYQMWKILVKNKDYEN